MLIDDKFKKNVNAVASPEDISFLEKSYQLINSLPEAIATTNQIIDLLQDCKNAFALMINKSLPPETIESCFEQYLKYLSDCSVYFLSIAIEEIIETQRFFPPIAEILDKHEQIAFKNDNLSSLTKSLIIKSKISIMPKTKENFEIVLKKPVSERSEIEGFYITFMREHYSNLFR